MPSAHAYFSLGILLGLIAQVCTQADFKRRPPCGEANELSWGSSPAAFCQISVEHLAFLCTHGAIVLASGNKSCVERCLLARTSSPSVSRKEPVPQALTHGTLYTASTV